MYFTTYENSYGAIADRWFEGMAEPLKLDIGRHQIIKISGAEKFVYLNNCKNESFYQCLSTKLKAKNQCAEQCTVFSLPDYSYPLCNNTVSETCQIQRFSKLFYGDICRGDQKSCVVQQYKAEEVNLKVQGQENKFQFSLALGEPLHSLGYRSSKPTKIIYTENLVVDEFTLLGNIGGQMGMLVGFSFSGFASWLLGSLVKLWVLVKKRQCVQK